MKLRLRGCTVGAGVANGIAPEGRCGGPPRQRICDTKQNAGIRYSSKKRGGSCSPAEEGKRRHSTKRPCRRMTRVYYTLSAAGEAYYAQLLEDYTSIHAGVEKILSCKLEDDA